MLKNTNGPTYQKASFFCVVIFAIFPKRFYLFFAGALYF